MYARQLGTLTLLALLSLTIGCVSQRYEVCPEARCSEPCNSPYPAPIRQHVYLFMMNGHDIFEIGAMMDLRERLCQAGYAKVYYAQRLDADWYDYEIRRICRADPDARFVLLSYGTAANKMTCLARAALRDQIPIDSVVYLDPVQVNENLAETLETHTITIRSHHWQGSPDLVTKESVDFSPVGHQSLPTHPATIEVVIRELHRASSMVHPPNVEELPHLPLRDKPAPTPRGVDPATLTGAGPDWDFLKLKPGFPSFPPLPQEKK